MYNKNSINKLKKQNHTHKQTKKLSFGKNSHKYSNKHNKRTKKYGSYDKNNKITKKRVYNKKNKVLVGGSGDEPLYEVWTAATQSLLTTGENKQWFNLSNNLFISFLKIYNEYKKLENISKNDPGTFRTFINDESDLNKYSVEYYTFTGKNKIENNKPLNCPNTDIIDDMKKVQYDCNECFILMFLDSNLWSGVSDKIDNNNNLGYDILKNYKNVKTDIIEVSMKLEHIYGITSKDFDKTIEKDENDDHKKIATKIKDFIESYNSNFISNITKWKIFYKNFPEGLNINSDSITFGNLSNEKFGDKDLIIIKEKEMEETALHILVSSNDLKENLNNKNYKYENLSKAETALFGFPKILDNKFKSKTTESYTLNDNFVYIQLKREIYNQETKTTSMDYNTEHPIQYTLNITYISNEKAYFKNKTEKKLVVIICKKDNDGGGGHWELFSFIDGKWYSISDGNSENVDNNNEIQNGKHLSLAKKHCVGLIYVNKDQLDNGIKKPYPIYNPENLCWQNTGIQALINIKPFWDLLKARIDNNLDFKYKNELTLNGEKYKWRDPDDEEPIYDMAGDIPTKAKILEEGIQYSVFTPDTTYEAKHNVDYWLNEENYEELIKAITATDNFRKNQYNFMKANKEKITKEFLNNLTADFNENYTSLITILNMKITDLKNENTEEESTHDKNDNDSLIEVLLDLVVDKFKEIKTETKNNLIFIFRKIILPTVLENKCKSQNKNNTIDNLLGGPQNLNPLLTIDDCNVILECYKINLKNNYQIYVDKSNNKVVITHTFDNKEKIITITINNSIFTSETKEGPIYTNINDELKNNTLRNTTNQKKNIYEVPVIGANMWLNKDTYDKNYTIDETLKSLMQEFIDSFNVDETKLDDNNILTLTTTVIKKKTTETKPLDYDVSDLSGLQKIFKLIKNMKINEMSGEKDIKEFKNINTVQTIPDELDIQTENPSTYNIPSIKLIYVILSCMLTDFVLTENVEQNRIMSFLVGHVIIPYLLKDATINSNKFNLQQKLLQLGELDLTHLNTLVSFLQTQFNKNFIIINEIDTIISKTFKDKNAIIGNDKYYIIKINNDNTITKVDNGEQKFIKGEELKKMLTPKQKPIQVSTSPILVSSQFPTPASYPVQVSDPKPSPVSVSSQFSNQPLNQFQPSVPITKKITPLSSQSSNQTLTPVPTVPTTIAASSFCQLILNTEEIRIQKKTP